VPSFGEVLKELRLKAGLTQADLVARAGVTPAAVKQLEQDRCNPTLPTMLLFARFFGVSLAVFDDVTPRPTKHDANGRRRKKAVKSDERRPRGRPKNQ